MRRLIPAASLLLAAACNGGNGETGQGAFYQLARVDGQSLPVVLRSQGGCDHMLLDGSIDFPGDRTYSSVFRIELFCQDSTPPGPQLGTSGLVVSRGDTLYFQNADGANVGHGIMTQDSLVVEGPERTLSYMRVRR